MKQAAFEYRIWNRRLIKVKSNLAKVKPELTDVDLMKISQEKVIRMEKIHFWWAQMAIAGTGFVVILFFVLILTYILCIFINVKP